jgi:prepilin-type N-terminal cleavage/methylation domain-containing protein
MAKTIFDWIWNLIELIITLLIFAMLFMVYRKEWEYLEDWALGLPSPEGSEFSGTPPPEIIQLLPGAACAA